MIRGTVWERSRCLRSLPLQGSRGLTWPSKTGDERPLPRQPSQGRPKWQDQHQPRSVRSGPAKAIHPPKPHPWPSPLAPPAEDIGPVTSPGSDVQAVAQRANIGFPSELKPMGIRDFGQDRHSVFVSSAARHIFSPMHMRYLEHGGQHPYAEYILQRYLEKTASAAPLWIYPVSNAGDGGKAFVRTAARFRLQHAFVAALNRNGYDRAGRRLGDGGASSVAAAPAATFTGASRVAQLYGTVRLSVTNPRKMMQLTFEELVGYAEKVVKRLEVTNGLDTLGNAVTRPRAPESPEKSSRGPPRGYRSEGGGGGPKKQQWQNGK